MKRAIRNYLAKMRGGEEQPPFPPMADLVWSGVGAAVGVAATGYLSILFDAPLFMVSFGSSCVLVFALPGSRYTQPRNIVAGHLIAVVVGLLLAEAIGAEWWAMALAIAVMIAINLATRTLHPPAGGTILYVMIEHPDWMFLAMPTLAGSLLIVVCAVVFNNFSKGRRYPRYWF
jgi:CBS-domain-containing membrane protein